MQRRALALLDQLGEPAPLLHPVRRLQELAGEADRWLEVCRVQVQELDGNLAIVTPLQGEQVRAVVREYTGAMERLHKMAADLVRLNLEERARAADEAEVAVFVRAVDVMLARVVPPEIHVRARDVLAAELERADRAVLPAAEEAS